jgi:hypothetical protein
MIAAEYQKPPPKARPVLFILLTNKRFLGYLLEDVRSLARNCGRPGEYPRGAVE